MRRLSITFFLLFGCVAAYSRLDLFFSHKFFDNTGRAEWIWDRHRVAQGTPIAFFATSDFQLPADRLFTKIKITGDPEYTLYFNGEPIGSRHYAESSTLEVYDVSKLARTGANRIVVAVRSINGVGGLIASIDLSPELLNYVVTGRSWRIYRSWSPSLVLRELPELQPLTPMSLGRPPMRRWNYLARTPGRPLVRSERLVDPRASNVQQAALAEIQNVNGVPVTVSHAIPATVFDFGGGTDGRLRLRLEEVAQHTRVVKVRFANVREELPSIDENVVPFVFAAGEQSVDDPDARHFRYAMVYARDASVSVDPAPVK